MSAATKDGAGAEAVDRAMAYPSALSAEQRDELDAPLDRSRVQERQGRGGGKLSYLATHDVVRTANRIFGYGCWGHEIVEQDRIGEVEIESRDGKRKGWHVGYRCVVRLTVQGCVPVSGSGYGDGVEYGPAAQITASELALKESESDALKRALKNFGDQFGLILYAGGDEQARIERDQAADQAQAAHVPMSVHDALARLSHYVEDPKPWVKEAAEKLHPGVEFTNLQALPEQRQRIELIRRLQEAVITLEADAFDPYSDSAVTRGRVRAAFAGAFEGVEVLGPDPFAPPVPF